MNDRYRPSDNILRGGHNAAAESGGREGQGLHPATRTSHGLIPQNACLTGPTRLRSLCSKRRSARPIGTPSERLEVCLFQPGGELEELMAVNSIAGHRDAEGDVGFPADRFGEATRRLGDRESHGVRCAAADHL
jgi:hypothetical protein